jgi:hypothetical protein
MRDWSSEFSRGVWVIAGELPPGFIPPSASMDPNATVNDEGLEALTNTPPAARIERVGRWRYSICITYGILQRGPEGGWWYRCGRASAERKARRELARFRAEQERETWTIT